MDLTGFDLNLLRVFVALWRERSATRAGDQIAMSQPAVSAALNRLRHALDDQLFVRRGNAMVPTPRAEELAEPVQEALRQLQEALQIKRPFDPQRLQRTWTLVGADFFSMLLMPPLGERLTAQAPGMRLRLLDSGRGDVGRMLLDDVADVVLEAPIDLPRESISRMSLFRSDFTVVARADHPRLLAQGVSAGDAMPIELFCELPHVLRTIDGDMTGYTDTALAKRGRSRRVVLALPHFYAVILAVARGSLIAVVPQRFAGIFAPSLSVNLYRVPIEVPAPEIQMYWHSRHDKSPAHRWLREQIVAVLASLSG